MNRMVGSDCLSDCGPVVGTRSTCTVDGAATCTVQYEATSCSHTLSAATVPYEYKSILKSVLKSDYSTCIL